MKFEGIFGHVNKLEFIKYLYKQIDVAFKKDEFKPSTPFARAYGIKGVYLSDLDDEILSSPLVVIQSSDLAELVAAKKLADYWADREGYNDQQIQIKAKEISKNYLIENGMSEETYKFFEELHGEKEQ
jgi:hypothetical protein